ncbi:MAG: helix-turn-helix transcriptional regulator [Candidatus Limnocylindrales bacterium]
MDRRMVTGTEFGAVVRARREAMGLDLDTVSRAIGGTPGPGFLRSFEEGSVGPSSSLVLKLAAVLDLPSDQMLNAGGYATEGQRATALTRLAGAPLPPASES